MHEEKKEVTKKVEGKDVKEMKTWSYYELSDFKYITYREFEERIQHASSGLANLGLSKNTHFNIYAATRKYISGNCCVRTLAAHSASAFCIPAVLRHLLPASGGTRVIRCKAALPGVLRCDEEAAVQFSIETCN